MLHAFLGDQAFGLQPAQQRGVVADIAANLLHRTGAAAFLLLGQRRRKAASSMVSPLSWAMSRVRSTGNP